MGAGSRDGAMMRAVISHRYHCDLDSTLVPGVTCGLSLLLVLVLARGGGGGRGFPLVSGFPPSSKTNISNFQFDLETGDRKGHLVDCPLINQCYYHHYYYFLLLLLLLSSKAMM